MEILIASYFVISLIASITVVAVCIAAGRQATPTDREEVYDQHLASIQRLSVKYDDRLHKKLADLK